MLHIISLHTYRVKKSVNLVGIHLDFSIFDYKRKWILYKLEKKQCSDLDRLISQVDNFTCTPKQRTGGFLAQLK